MKNILFAAALILLTFNGFTQSQKSDLKFTVSALPLIGTSGSFGSGINGFAIKPALGYYISEKTSLELNFSYATLNDLSVWNVDSYYNSYAFIPSLRNNFVNKEKWRVFAELGFGLGTIKYDAENASFRNPGHSDLSGGISILNIGVGGNYFFTEKFGVELIIPYISTRNITSNNSNNLYSGIGPTLGFAFVLN